MKSIYDNPDLITDLKEYGFQGFVTVAKLRRDGCDSVPKEKGVYMALNFCSKPGFLKSSVGGHFKDKDPTVSDEILKSHWVEGTSILYIGQAGGNNMSGNLKRRIKLYMDFGQTKPVPHWGGRFVWQLKNHGDLMICWMTTDCDPRQKEKELLSEFMGVYGRRPFANLRD